MTSLEKAHRLLAPRIAYLVGSRAADLTQNIIPVSNVTSVSTNPQQVVVAVFKQWETHRTLLKASGFTLSVPHIDQLEGVWKLGAKYSRYPYRSNIEKIHASGLDIDDAVSEFGPVLADGIGWLALRTVRSLDLGGDHTLFVAQVERAHFNPRFLNADGTPRPETHPVMQVTGNLFTTSGDPQTVPYYS